MNKQWTIWRELKIALMFIFIINITFWPQLKAEPDVASQMRHYFITFLLLAIIECNRGTLIFVYKSSLNFIASLIDQEVQLKTNSFYRKKNLNFKWMRFQYIHFRCNVSHCLECNAAQHLKLKLETKYYLLHPPFIGWL